MNKLIFFAIALVIGIALFIVVIGEVGFEKIINTILVLKPWHFAVLIVLYGIGFAISAFRWKIILNAGGNFVTFRKILAARMVGHAINYLTPSGLVMGEPFKAMVLVGESNIKLGAAAVSVVVEAAIFLSTLLLVIIFGILSFITYSGVSQKIFFAIAAVLAFLILIFYFFYARMIKESSGQEKEKRGFFTHIIFLFRLDKISFVNKWKDRIARGESRVREFFSLHREIVVFSVLLSLAEIAVMLFAHWLAILFLGFKISAKTLLGVFSLMSMANVLPLPGALGGLELSQVFAFSFFALGGQVTALAFSLITRIINLIYVAIGIAYLIHFEIKIIAGKIMGVLPDIGEKIKNFFKNF